MFAVAAAELSAAVVWTSGWRSPRPHAKPEPPRKEPKTIHPKTLAKPYGPETLQVRPFAKPLLLRIQHCSHPYASRVRS